MLATRRWQARHLMARLLLSALGWLTLLSKDRPGFTRREYASGPSHPTAGPALAEQALGSAHHRQLSVTLRGAQQCLHLRGHPGYLRPCYAWWCDRLRRSFRGMSLQRTRLLEARSVEWNCPPSLRIVLVSALSDRNDCTLQDRGELRLAEGARCWLYMYAGSTPRAYAPRRVQCRKCVQPTVEVLTDDRFPHRRPCPSRSAMALFNFSTSLRVRPQEHVAAFPC